MWGTKTESRHRWQCGVVVRGGDARGRGRRPRSREFYAKNARDGVGAGMWGHSATLPCFGGFFLFFSIFSGFFVSNLHSAKALPSARQKILGKDAFTDPFFTEWSLPSAALDKAFAEYKLGFAECAWHSANPVSPVVQTCSLSNKGPS